MSSAALPGAALRVMRTAAGWRALRLALLLGGLFLLGVVCGERAQAAEGVPSVPDAVGTVLDVVPAERVPASSVPPVPPASEAPSAVPDTRPGRAAGPSVPDGLRPVTDHVVRPVTGHVVRPVTDHVVRTVTDQVVRPAGEVVGTVTEELGEAVRAEVPLLEALTQLPTAPSLPAVPSTPPLSTLPDASEPPGGSGLPGPPVRPVPGDREPGSATAPVTAPDADELVTAGRRAVSAVPAADSRADAATVAYGPALDGHGGTRLTAAHDDAHGVASGPPAPAPAHHAPSGGADGALGSGTGADGGPPRHGDAQAIAPHHRVPVRLVPGAVVHADAPEPRERYRDIPVSPA
ncbi:hypothetical protein AB0E77_01625 [Streptomyces sp. NPDC032940]|uniref:hypothetical protein n=1 Tax=Streptomyces sp. NPDC032940 TaxID=3155366 RepID=UPI0033E8B9C1